MSTTISRRGFLALGGAAAIGLGLTGTLAGCSSTGSSGSLSGTSLAILPSTAPSNWKTVLAKFNAGLKKEHGFELDAQFINWTNYAQQSLLKFTAGAKFDTALQALWLNMAQLQQDKSLVDLTKEIDALPNKANLQSGHIKAGTVDGKEHTLPFVTDISVMVWNKDLYQQAGLDPNKGPTNLDEFVAQAKAVAALGKKDVAGTYIAGQSGGALVFTLFPMLWGNGDQALNDAGTQALLDSDSAKKIYAAYRELANTPNGIGAGSKDETGATWTAPFQNGKVGVMPYPFTAVSALFKTAPFQIGVAPIPGVSSGSSTFLGGDAIGISKDSKHVAQAWNFLAWLMTDQAQQAVFADNNDTASNLSVLENGYKNADPRTLVGNGTIKNGQTPIATNFNEAFNAAGSPWQILIQDAIWGDASKTAADNNAITAALAQ